MSYMGHKVSAQYILACIITGWDEAPNRYSGRQLGSQGHWTRLGDRDGLVEGYP